MRCGIKSWEKKTNGQYKKKNNTRANHDICDAHNGNGIDHYRLDSLMKNKYKYELMLWDKYQKIIGWNRVKNVKCIKKVPANKINIPLRGFHVN